MPLVDETLTDNKPYLGACPNLLHQTIMILRAVQTDIHVYAYNGNAYTPPEPLFPFG